MDFFLKRIPAFSRALGEWESEEESDPEGSLLGAEEEPTCLDSENRPVKLEDVLKGQSIQNVIIAVGPVQTAFVTCAYQLSKLNTMAQLSYIVPGFGGVKKTITNQVYVHYLPDVEAGTVCIVLPQSRQAAHVNQRNVAHRLLSNVLAHSDVHLPSHAQVTILCTQPISQFQSNRPPDSPSFIRILTTQAAQIPEKAHFKWLEQPNIISDLPAEFLTWCNLRSIPAVLSVLFYTPLDNPAYAWQATKEMFKSLCTLKSLSPVLGSIGSDWTSLDDHTLKDACITYVCGNKPTQMDQMYT